MPEARPEFVHLTEAEVWRGMDDAGAVEAEVTRLVALLTIRLMASGGMQVRARCPIERVAVLMLAKGGVDVRSAH